MLKKEDSVMHVTQLIGVYYLLFLHLRHLLLIIIIIIVIITLPFMGDQIGHPLLPELSKSSVWKTSKKNNQCVFVLTKTLLA